MFRNLRIAPEGYGIITFAFIICLLFNILTIHFNLAWLSLTANTMIFLFVGTFYWYGKNTFPQKRIEFFPKTEPSEAVVNITAPIMLINFLKGNLEQVININSMSGIIYHDRVFMMDPASRFLDDIKDRFAVSGRYGHTRNVWTFKRPRAKTYATTKMWEMWSL